jgi:hypothetical protein
MKSTDIRFEVEIHLITGRIVTYGVPEDRVTEIVSRPGWVWPAGIPDETKPFVGVFSDIANRVNKGTGFLQAKDLDGRSWLMRAESIVAFSIKDYREPPVPRPIGFELPILDKTPAHS